MLPDRTSRLSLRINSDIRNQATSFSNHDTNSAPATIRSALRHGLHHGSFDTCRQRETSATPGPSRHRARPSSIPQPALEALSTAQQECQTAHIRELEKGGLGDGHTDQLWSIDAAPRHHLRQHRRKPDPCGGRLTNQHRASRAEPLHAGPGKERSRGLLRPYCDLHQHRVRSVLEPFPADPILRHHWPAGPIHGPQDETEISRQGGFRRGPDVGTGCSGELSGTEGCTRCAEMSFMISGSYFFTMGLYRLGAMTLV